MTGEDREGALRDSGENTGAGGGMLGDEGLAICAEAAKFEGFKGGGGV